MFDGLVESASFICYFYESSVFFGHLRYDSINSTFQKEEDRILGVKAGTAYSETNLILKPNISTFKSSIFKMLGFVLYS